MKTKICVTAAAAALCFVLPNTAGAASESLRASAKPVPCQTAACAKRVAERQAKASARWCAKNRACRDRVAYRRQIRALTPFSGPNGTRWAIPYYVVACESHGRWNAYNPSGALGPYQLLGHGAPFPANTASARLRHHQIARRLYLTQGLRPWVCA